ncbi:hypothetical protein Hypma_014843 [Hypsizygus marmoreus]|uniref:DUF7918 domain-containing protein n=1 Tax=Hypsizygus marmoreus TaxID=39966 RepID=A0A369KA67_HYPMA|nr:hypothetical protein Hypma_014843 [Hypsizygus marmoreus]
MKLADFEAHINVDGVALPEYSCQTDKDGEKVSCWIPSEAGKSFTVSWKTLVGKPYEISGKVNIDGNSLGGRIQYPNATMTVEHTGASISSTTERPFIFSSLNTTDDDTYLNNTTTMSIGDITIAFWEIVTGEETYAIPITLSNEKVHERSKKAMAHRVELGELKERSSRKTVMATNVRVLSTFVFKYRSIDILRAEGIAPPDPAAQKRKADDIDGKDDDDEEEEEEEPGNGNEEADQAELKALLEKVNAIQSKLAKKAPKVKGNKRVKTESYSAFVPGEVIDLT